MVLGHKIIGTGSEHVIVMHDWFSDCSSYDSVLPYLDVNTFTYVFADLRGYGKSKEIAGKYNVDEAAQDIVALADSLKWDRFHVVGHSMTGMVSQRIAANVPNRVKCVVAITPTPASGSGGAPKDIVAFMEDAASKNDQAALQVVAFMTSNRYSPQFSAFKVRKWRELALAEARVAYMYMFVETDFSKDVKGLKTPFLVLVGDNDAEGQREPVMQGTFMQWYPNCELMVLQNTGHYPMQEIPVTLATTMEQFLKKHLSAK